MKLGHVIQKFLESPWQHTILAKYHPVQNVAKLEQLKNYTVGTNLLPRSQNLRRAGGGAGTQAPCKYLDTAGVHLPCGISLSSVKRLSFLVFFKTHGPCLFTGYPTLPLYWLPYSEHTCARRQPFWSPYCRAPPSAGWPAAANSSAASPRPKTGELLKDSPHCALHEGWHQTLRCL